METNLKNNKELINWKGYEWMLQETWGQIHPDHTNMWKDSSAVSIVNDQLILKTHQNLKYFEELSAVSVWGCGFACCMEKFFFGHYKIEAKLPQGTNLWPAIWLYSHESWPPEIDILEAYSNDKGSYKNISTTNISSFFNSILNPYKFEGNFHIKGKGSLGSKRCKTNWFTNVNKFITYEMIWDSNYIKLYANGKLFYELKGTVMDNFQEPMRFILSNGVRKNKINYIDETSMFIIKDFIYVP